VVFFLQTDSDTVNAMLESVICCCKDLKTNNSVV